MIGPLCLATDLNGFTIVADSDNHRVAIFDKDGYNIHCFGSRGSANGHFYYPDGIALGPNSIAFMLVTLSIKGFKSTNQS